MRSFLRYAAGLAALLVTSTVSSGGEAAVVPAKTPWIILASEEVPAAQTIKAGATLLQSRVVPAGLIVLDADLPAPGKPEPLLVAGTQMFRLLVDGSNNVYCSTHPRKGQLADVLLVRSADTYVCAIDGDNDGQLDSFYQLRTKNNTSLPIFQSARSEGDPILRGLAYHRIDPRDYTDLYHIRIVYYGKRLLGRKHNFGVTFGTDKAPLPLTERVAVDLASDARWVTLMKANFRLDEATDNGASISIRRGIPLQPFLLRIPAPQIMFIYY